MPITVWLIFFAIYAALLALDLGVLHRESAVMSIGGALYVTLMWLIIALLFGVLVFGVYEYKWFGVASTLNGSQAVLQFVTGYVLEWSLSIDNIFVMAMILAYLQIPQRYQYRVLFWGVIGAVMLRGLMIAVGAALIHAFDWTFYLFGAILLWSAISMSRSDNKIDPERSAFMRITRRIMPVSGASYGDKFLVKEQGGLVMTPLLVSLLLVDLADVVFAVDSIPAVFAVTQDTFLVFTSNAFAILGLRALYFAVAGMISRFKYFRHALVMILVLVSIKMLLHAYVKIPDGVSLLMVLAVLTTATVASMWVDRREKIS